MAAPLRTPVTKRRDPNLGTTPAPGLLPPGQTSTPGESWADQIEVSDLQDKRAGENSSFFAYLHSDSFISESIEMETHPIAKVSNDTLSLSTIDLLDSNSEFIPAMTRKAKRLLRTTSRIPKRRHRNFHKLAGKLVWQNNIRIK